MEAICLYHQVFKATNVPATTQLTNGDGCTADLCGDCANDPEVLAIVMETYDDKPFNG